MSHSSIPRMSNRSSVSKEKPRTPFLIVFLSIMLAVYIGFIAYWLITDDSNADLAASSAVQVQVSAVSQQD